MKSNICKNIKNFPSEKASGAMAQYLKIKSGNMDKIVFFRLGEFYETYFEDALSLSSECQIALTQKKLKVGNVLMAGVPSSSLAFYISKLVDLNKKIAVCEEEEQEGEKLRKRKVTRIYTKGNLIDGELIKNSGANYLCSLFQKGNEYGLSFCDVSTGEFFLTQGNREEIASELQKLEPTEVLCVSTRVELIPFQIIKDRKPNIDLDLSGMNVTLLSEKSYEKSPYKFKSESHPLGQKCANAIINYIEETQQNFTPKFRDIRFYDVYDYLYINERVHKKLELTRNQSDGRKYGSLFWVLDKTKTPMGERTLKSWITYPLKDSSKIRERQGAILEFYENPKISKSVQELLSNCFDIKRLWGKLTSKTLSRKDFISLIKTLKIIKPLMNHLATFKNELIKFKKEDEEALIELCDFLEKMISEDIEKDELIKKGANSELDYLRDEIKKESLWLFEYLNKEKEKTGIKNLRLGFNKPLGHHFEIPHSNKNKIPQNYKIRQNLSSMNRYTTEELTKSNQKQESLNLKIKNIELEEFSKIKEYTFSFREKINSFGSFLAQIDALLSLYFVSAEENFSLPQLSENFRFSVTEGFHPAAKKLLKKFTNNGLKIKDNKKFIILTGPNMAGKSTFLKQNAIIAVLGQIGSFVSAKKAELGIFDKIFIRSGSDDEILKARSTFMIEMTEIKDILDFATSKSMVLIDELGSGTSKQDGLALAEGICGYIIEKINPLVIFATHSHELINLMQNYSENIEFLTIGKDFDLNKNPERKIERGFSLKSYGINIAKAVNLPKEVIERAEKFLYS